MQLSKETVDILKNFASINTNLVVRKGNVLRTQDIGRTVMAQAELPEAFSQEFGIYDLGDFLGVLSLFKNPTITLNDGYLMVDGAGGKVRFNYATIDYLIAPSDKPIKLPESIVSFDMKSDEFELIRKSASILKSKHLVIEKVKGETKLYLTDIENPSSNSMTLDLTVAVADSVESCKLIWSMESLKMIPCDYTVHLSENKLSWFKSDNLLYVVGLNKDSKFTVAEESAPWDNE